MNYMKMGSFAATIARQKYLLDNETWEQLAQRVSETVFAAVNAPGDLVDYVRYLIATRKFIPGGRYLFATGRPFHQTQNCCLFRAQDSREGWASLGWKNTKSLMTGAGIGNTFGLVRPRGLPIKKTGGVATGPLALMQIINETGRQVMQGGSRRSAIWAGLPWWHPDVQEFIYIKDWSDEVKALKAKDFNFPATMDMTNISIQLDDGFFKLIDRNPVMNTGILEYNNTWGDVFPTDTDAQNVYKRAIHQMLSTGEPGFSIDVGENAGEELRNACTEITSRDDSDICNLGSINMARIESLQEMSDVVSAATAFLIAGTVYSDVPTKKIRRVRDKNRRLGLGIMGIHEWLLVRGKKYAPDSELSQYLAVYENMSDVAAALHAKQYSLSVPVKVRAVAPTGTIGIVGETTTGIEPIFCVAYKRRYLKMLQWNYQYVVDPTAKRIISEGDIHPDDVEDAYSLSEDVERRVAFQAWVQGYVDHGISSTINLPAWGSPQNNEDHVEEFGKMLLKYLPKLRGITCYPDGARGGQPLTPTRYSTASKYSGEEYVEQYSDVCDLTRGGSCGS